MYVKQWRGMARGDVMLYVHTYVYGVLHERGTRACRYMYARSVITGDASYCTKCHTYCTRVKRERERRNISSMIRTYMHACMRACIRVRALCSMNTQCVHRYTHTRYIRTYICVRRATPEREFLEFHGIFLRALV